MDKYDIIFIYRNIRDFLKEDMNELLKKYFLWKKDLLVREYAILRNRKSFEYNKKKGQSFMKSTGVHKAFSFNLRQKYAWDLFNPIKEKKE